MKTKQVKEDQESYGGGGDRGMLLLKLIIILGHIENMTLEVRESVMQIDVCGTALRQRHAVCVCSVY